MTSKARVVLQDVKFAIAFHTDKLQAEELRISWFSIVALLRAVGHVLDKVDRESSPNLKRAISEKWAALNQSRPDPQIFWGFIEWERNRFLKNYEHGISRTFTIEAGEFRGARTWVTQDVANSRGGSISIPGAEYSSSLTDGPFAGRHERDVALEAHDWWKRYLDEVDALADSYRQ